jgi:hypothetical protein
VVINNLDAVHVQNDIGFWSCCDVRCSHGVIGLVLGIQITAL